MGWLHQIDLHINLYIHCARPVYELMHMQCHGDRTTEQTNNFSCVAGANPDVYIAMVVAFHVSAFRVNMIWLASVMIPILFVGLAASR